jgi:hypothetical protein
MKLKIRNGLKNFQGSTKELHFPYNEFLMGNSKESKY